MKQHKFIFPAGCRFLLVGIIATLGACSTLNKLTDNGETAKGNDSQRQQSSQKERTKPDYGDFNLDKDTLYDLLVAEIAAQRDQFNITLVNYIQQARATRDPAIIRRAINAAQYSKDLEAIRELGLLWVDVEPDSIPAHQLMAFQHSLQQEYADAIHHIDRLIELGGDARVESLAVGSTNLPDEESQRLLKLYQGLQEKYPDNNEVAYSVALVHRNLEHYDDALAILDSILERDSAFQAAMVLRANTLYENGEAQRALEYAGEQYDEYPRNHSLGRLYASLLIEDRQLNEAEQVFAELLELYPQSPGLQLSHALVMLENGKEEAAAQQLEALIEQDARPDEAHFYLGRIADRQDRKETAISHYSQVEKGIHFESALERSSYLLTQTDQTQQAIDRLARLREEKPGVAQKLWILQYKLLSAIEEDALAMETLDDAIEQFPDDEKLLYARAMSHEANGDLKAMEADLRRIIKLNPKHAVALNALGYTLADRNERLQEAAALVSMALSLKPENPMILDSMGWVLYRMGQPEKALIFLTKAFQSFADPEVGAHLGEVLWELGKQNDAAKLWRPMLMKYPEHEVLLETIQRYDMELFDRVMNEIKEKELSGESEDEPLVPGATVPAQ